MTPWTETMNPHLIKTPGAPTRQEAENVGLRACDLIAAAAAGDRRRLDQLAPQDLADARAVIGALAEVGASMGRSFGRPLDDVLDVVRMHLLGDC